jgi:RNA polymerase sigma factor (sigma-70 family)
LTIEGRERVSSAEALVQNADFLGLQIGELQMDMGDRQIEEVEGPSLEQLAIEADMFMRASERARKELEESGWLSAEDREMHANAIRVGREAEVSIEDAVSDFWCRMSTDDLTRASEVFLANSQLCRQILDKEPDAKQSLLDIHFEACLKLKELRDACRALATSMPNGEPEQSPHVEWLLQGANDQLSELIVVFEAWEQKHAEALKEAHARDAEDILRRIEESVGVIPTGEGVLAKVDPPADKLLTKEEEFDLGRSIEEGNKAYKDLSEFGWQSDTRRSELAETIRAGQVAKWRLAVMNLRLVASIAGKVQRQFANFKSSNLTFDDLVQEGNIGLVHAVEKYDWRRGYRFSTYATYQIRQAIRKAILQTGSTIRIPLGRREQIRKLKLMENSYQMKHGRKPTQTELSQGLGITNSVLKKIQEFAEKGDLLVELDAYKERGFSSDRQVPLMSSISGGALTPLEALTLQEEKKRGEKDLSVMLKNLTKEELTAIGMRYGLHDGERASCQQIADHFGIHASTANRLVRNAVSKLQRAAKEHRLRNAVEGEEEEEELIEYDIAAIFQTPL